MRHVYEFNDFPISEDLLLGLGAGVGFVYWHIKGTPPILGGRGNVGRPAEEGLERAAGRRTGVRVVSFRTSSAGRAEKAALDLLGKGDPMMVMLDMGFLPYLGLPKDYHFGGHAVVLAGYDLQRREVVIADRDGTPHSVSFEALASARGSKFKPFPPHNQWFTFDFSHKRQTTAKETLDAIHEVAKGMLKPPIANLGVKGIRTAAERVLNWPNIMAAQALRYACLNAFIFIDARGGSGGGIFRYMYARFLKEVASIIGDEEFNNAGRDMRMIGDEWQGIADLFHKAYTDPDPSDSIAKASERMLTVADHEENVWNHLSGIVSRSGGT